jgi:hypothetical protein
MVMGVTLPSLQSQGTGENRGKPRILVLEIYHPERPSEKPVAWLMVERSDSNSRDQDGKIYDATIRLSYEEILPPSSFRKRRHGEFDACYSAYHGLVKLTSHRLDLGALSLDLEGLEGHRIGTYLMNEIVHWVKQWPEASVMPIELRAEQAVGDNRARRNRFYEQFGLEFDYADPAHRAGWSKPMLVKELKQVTTWEQNITEHELFDYLGDVLNAKREASAGVTRLAHDVERLQERLAQAYARPVCWALKIFYDRYANLVAGAVFLAACAVAAVSGLTG